MKLLLSIAYALPEASRGFISHRKENSETKVNNNNKKSYSWHIANKHKETFWCRNKQMEMFSRRVCVGCEE